MQAATHMDAIVFDIDGHKLLKIAWVYDENDDLDSVYEEVWCEIKKATRAASEDQLQILTAKGAAIHLRRCLQKALQGNAAVISTIEDGQLMLKVEVLGKVAGKGRATGEAAGCAGRLPEAAAPPTQAQRPKQQYSATHIHVNISPKLVLCTAGANRARSTGRSMARQASSSSSTAATATSTAAAAA
jgi:hypothetical protein